MATGFHRSWGLHRMPTQGPDARRVDVIATDNAFWAKVRVVADLGDGIDVERRWMRGCPYHEEECICFAKKGNNFQCPNQLKSCRGPQPRARLHDTLDRWRNNQIALRTNSDDGPTGEIYRATHAAFGHLLGLVKHTFKFIVHLPYRFWEARDPAVARTLLDMYREGVGRGLQYHRVAARCCEGDLSADFIDHCEGRGLPPRLDAELKALECAKFDGASAEAVHGQLARIAVVSTASSCRFKASGARAKQDWTECGLYCSLGWASRPTEFWNKYKAVVQRGICRRGQLTPKRVGDADFCADVYRYGWHSQHDWSELSTGKPDPRRAQASTTFGRIKKDFITTLVKPHQLYSVLTDQEMIDDARLHPLGGDGEVGDPVRELSAFEVIDLHPNAKRVPEAYGAKTMFCPAMVRKWILHGAGPLPQSPVQLTLRPSSDGPAAMDIRAMSSWKKRRDSLRMWADRAPSEIHGCLDVSKPVDWNDMMPLPWAPATCPAATTVAKMEELGWVEGEPHHRPLPIADKLISYEDATSRKSYLLALMDADSLHARGCDAIRAGQSELHCRCPLNVDPRTPPSHNAEYYRKALKQGGFGDLAEIVVGGDGVAAPIRAMGAALGAGPRPLPAAGEDSLGAQVHREGGRSPVPSPKGHT
ncbi:unnamed protein product [Prorocentrum cordatum]|uniref:Uncharacterized protein n=1 Tax=Prorocentrum cordatum TaxID=2364126 RepID=A0ABN9R1K0_9DINO|nr:unnamed protein product [Polarella glacialis]